jgi:hypothetical protein
VSKYPNPAKQQEIIARNVFKKFDEDDSNAISIDEFHNLIDYLGADFSQSELEGADMFILHEFQVHVISHLFCLDSWLYRCYGRTGHRRERPD